MAEVATQTPQEQWESARGIECPDCSKEIFRQVDGFCPTCALERALIPRLNVLSKRATRRRLTDEEQEEADGLQAFLHLHN